MPHLTPSRHHQLSCSACGHLHHPLAQACPSCGIPTPDTWVAWRPATMRLRLVAAVLDQLLVGLLLTATMTYVLATWKQTWPSGPYQAHLILSQITLYLSYFVCWMACVGNTPGKWICRLRVLDASQGTRPSLKQVLLREGWGRFLCVFALSPVAFLSAQLRHNRCRTLADEVSQTVVVRKRKQPRTNTSLDEK